MDRLVKVWLVALAALMPLVRPVLPGNTAIFDFVNVAAIPAFLAWRLMRGHVTLRLGVSAGVILLGSLVAMLNTRTIGLNVLALSQECYLFALFVTMDNVVTKASTLRLLVVSWMVAATAESLVLFSDLAADMNGRAQGTFENPNMASSYLGCSVFVAFHPVLKGRWIPRSLYVTIVTAAMLGTKSLSGLLALAAGALLLALGYQVRVNRRRIVRPVLAGMLLVAVGGAVLPQVLHVKNYMDRLPRSSSGRMATWRVGLQTFVENPFGTGIGPGAFVEVGVVTGGEWGVGRHKSLHSDYLSFLVERGFIGFLGLLGLLATIGKFLLMGMRNALDRRGLLWMFALSGLYAFILVDAFSHEVLHYRHVICAIGLIACQSRLESGIEERVSAKAPTDAPFEG